MSGRENGPESSRASTGSECTTMHPPLPPTTAFGSTAAPPGAGFRRVGAPRLVPGGEGQILGLDEVVAGGAEPDAVRGPVGGLGGPLDARHGEDRVGRKEELLCAQNRWARCVRVSRGRGGRGAGRLGG